MKLLIKLQSRIDEIPLDSAKRFGLIIARQASRIPDNPDEFGRPRMTAGFLIRKILQRLPQDSRKELALAVLADAEPLSFATMCLDWMKPQRNELPADNLFSSSDWQMLELALAERISQHATTTSLISGHPVGFMHLLGTWQQAKGSEPVRGHVRKALAANPQTALELIKPLIGSCFVRTGSQGIDQLEYDFIAKFADPDDLMTAFEALGLFSPLRTDAVAQAARQFAAIYRHEPSPGSPDSGDGASDATHNV
jgi:hypothetical protein